jgi:hypothetical protein
MYIIETKLQMRNPSLTILETSRSLKLMQKNKVKGMGQSRVLLAE